MDGYAEITFGVGGQILNGFLSLFLFLLPDEWKIRDRWEGEKGGGGG